MKILLKLQSIRQDFLLFPIIVLTLTACEQNTPQTQPFNQAKPKVTVAAPLVKDITDWDEFTGRLYPVESVEIRPRVSGYLQSIHFVEGSLVKEGDLLYVIDPRPYQAILDQTKAELSRARAGLKRAEIKLTRAKD
ncbi:MAG: efflux transporter periplasmic adaptor subunit, partial [Gammaproteobacteria bacterium]